MRPTSRLSFAAIAGLLLAQAVFVAAVVVTGESFWIDEFGTARIADVVRLSDWWEQFRTWHDSDIQMPLYHFYMFGWTQLFGFSEYAMRMANWPLFVVAGGVLLRTFRGVPVFAIALLTLSTFHPLVWYYLNEARPYAMVFLGAVCTFAPTVSLLAPRCFGAAALEGYSPWTFAFGVTVLAGSNMLGVLWAGIAVLLVCGFHWRFDREALLRYRWAYGTLLAGLAMLTSFFAYTLLRGARATPLYESSLGTLAFSVYELLGLSGLGPGRLDLREGGVAALTGWLLPVGLGAAVIGFGLLHGLKLLTARVGLRGMVVAGALGLVPMIAIVAVGFLLHWRVLGRHFMAEVPIVTALLAVSVAALVESGKRASLLAAAVLLAAVVASGISMTAPRHAKDDYRYAAAAAEQALAAQETVWWGAYAHGARYYGLPLQGAARAADGCPAIGARQQRAAVDVANLRPHCLQSLPRPDLVVLSKPDAFDTRGTLVSWLGREDFAAVDERPAFSFWRKRGSNIPTDQLTGEGTHPR